MILKSDRAPIVMAALGRNVGRVRRLFGVKRAEANSLAVCRDPGGPRVDPARSWVKADAKHACQAPVFSAAPATAALVLVVDGARHITKVCPSVVGSDAVDVVNMIFWPLSGLQQKGDSMRKVCSSVKTQIPVAIRPNPSGVVTNLCGARLSEASDAAGLRVVTQSATGNV